MATTATTQPQFRDYTAPDSLTTPSSKLVHFYITTMNGATIDELQTALEMKKITLFSVLQTLQSKSLITVTQTDAGRTYQPT